MRSQTPTETLSLVDLAAIMVAVLQLGDLVTTLLALSQGAREANPIVALLMWLLGRVPGLVLVKLIGVGFAWWLWTLGAETELWLLCAIYVWVVIHNLRVWRRYRG
jgi:hypothetical protein